MTPTELFSLFTSAYVNNSKIDRHNFIRSIKTFDFSKFRLYSKELCDLWSSNTTTDKKELITGGSTKSIANKYNYGPFKALIDLEIIQKSSGGRILWIAGVSKNPKPHVSYENGLVLQYNYELSSIYDLFNFIDSYSYRVKSRLTLCAIAYDWLYLTSHPVFVDLLLARKSKIAGIVSTDCEPLFKQLYLTQNGIHINDCMIDWQTGLNFHTCIYGKQHIMPIFLIDNGKFINWTNIANHTIYETLDECSINSLKPTKCKCGSYTLDIKVLPRSLKYFQFRRDIKELVRSHYINLQFVRSDNELTILYRTHGDLLPCDIDLFKHVFSDYKLIFKQNVIAMTGLKRPSWWDTKIGDVRFIEY